MSRRRDALLAMHLRMYGYNTGAYAPGSSQHRRYRTGLVSTPALSRRTRLNGLVRGVPVELAYSNPFDSVFFVNISCYEYKNIVSEYTESKGFEYARRCLRSKRERVYETVETSPER